MRGRGVVEDRGVLRAPGLFHQIGERHAMRFSLLLRGLSGRAAVVGLVAILGTATASASEADASAWKAGAVEVVITPEKNIWMAGYASRDHPAEGKAT